MRTPTNPHLTPSSTPSHDRPTVSARRPPEQVNTSSAEQRSNTIALGALLLATFMGFLDIFIVNVAAPSIRHDLPATFKQIQLVLSGYALAYAVGLVTGGRLGDTYGRRRLWLIGVAAFILMSFACGIAPSATVLIASRLLQGLAAALMLPQVLATIQVLFDGDRRTRALDSYGVVIGLASMSGQIVGGALIVANVAGTGWRAVFFVNVPVGLIALLVGARTVPQTRADHPPRLDLIGAGLLGGAIALLLYPMIAGPDAGWTTMLTVFVVTGLIAGAVFVLWEWGLEAIPTREPLLKLSLFGQPTFRWGLLVVLGFFAGNADFFLVLAFFLQSGLHLSAAGSGLGFLPLGVGFMVSSLASRALFARWGNQVPMAGTSIILISLLLALPALHGPDALPHLADRYYCGASAAS